MGKLPFFVHIPRTGGSVLRTALGISHQCHDCAKAVRGVLAQPPHETALQAKTRLGDQWTEYWSFSVVRSPYSRMASLYRLHKAKNPSDSSSFDTFVRRSLLDDDGFDAGSPCSSCTLPPSFFLPATRYLFDSDGSPLVDTIFFYENGLDAVYDLLYQKMIDLGNSAGDRAVIKGRQLPDRLPLQADQVRGFSALYTPFSRAVVAEHFESDLEAFGYNIFECNAFG